MNKYRVFPFILIMITACARVGRPTGGPKDTEPPKLIKSIPENNATNFKGRQIELHFNEYVTLKEPQKNILISPPLVHQPLIKPAGIASKTIKIIFHDSLQPDTTYLINFGESIADYNEGNILPNFQLVFSTGQQIDSLSLSGHATALHFAKPPKKIMLGLYPDAHFKDSMVYTQKPYYIAMANDKGQFKFTHLKKGRYRLIALADQNSDYKYQPGKEGIGFWPQAINVPSDSIYNIMVFKEYPRFSIDKIEQLSRNHFYIKYEGAPDSLQIKWDMPVQNFFMSNKNKKADIWYLSPSDSLKFHVKNGRRFKFYRRKRSEKEDSLMVSMPTQTKFSPIDSIYIKANEPLIKMDISKAHLLTDSISIPFKSYVHQGKIFLSFAPQPGKTYHLDLLPAAVTGLLKTKNKDSIKSSFKILSLDKFGTLKVHLKTNQELPVFIEVLKNGKVIKRTETQTKPDFEIPYLLPGKYDLRIISDLNKNKRWDSGNYLKHLLPEPIFSPSQPIEIRANWEINQTYNLK